MSEQSEQTRGDTFRLCSDRLEVEVAWPGSAIQKGARFDLTGHMVQVTLDGKHVFCAPEDHDEKRGSGGLGLCNEFWDFSDTLYNSTRKLEQYPKFGVGLLTRASDESRNFMEHYQKAIYPIDVSVSDSSATFTVQPVDCQGYAAKITKKLSVASNTIFVAYSFENVGSMPIDLMEYNHNFICIDQHRIGPDYRFSMPTQVEMAEVPGVLSIQGNEITWKDVPNDAFYCQPRVPGGTTHHVWELVHAPSGVGIREIDDFPVDHMALWGKSHVVSPEVFIRINLKPGEALQWSRRYELFDHRA